MWKDFVMKWKPKVDEKIVEFFKGKEGLAGRFKDINERALSFAEDFTVSGGKRVRPILFLAGYISQGKEPDDSILKVAAAIELIHSFLLIHDDIMDKDEVRRGKPTVWKRFENAGFDRHTAYSMAITTGDLVYTYALQLVLESGLPWEMREVVLRNMLRTVEDTGYGQNLDVYFPAKPVEEVSPEDVMLVYKQKTGYYTIVFPLTTGAEIAGADKGTLEALSDYGLKVGIAFQVHDDILGVFGDPEKTGKPVGNDIREGKRTILVLEAYRRGSPEDKEIIRRYLGTDDEDGVKKVMEVIERTGALDYAKELERNLVEEGKRALEKARISEEIRTFLKEFADYLITREK